MSAIVGRVAIVLLAGALLMAAAITVRNALALFSSSPSVPGNAFATDTLDPPTGVTAAGGASVSVGWTATADTYAGGHRVFRGTASGGPYTQIAEVTPRTTTTYTDNPPAGAYYYVARAFYQNWESADSNEAAASCCTVADTGWLSPAAQAADTGGDGDGFETNPANAFALDGSEAWDANSGTDTATSCAGAGKDRHRYYDYGISVPANASINGIEVRLDARVQTASGTRFMCVELSWDGGATWTAYNTTSALSTSTITYTLGSSADTWGRAWNVSGDFTNANFRIRITDVSDDNTQRFQLDWAAVRVTYTHP